jgi:hypothetical protein
VQCRAAETLSIEEMLRRAQHARGCAECHYQASFAVTRWRMTESDANPSPKRRFMPWGGL